MPSNLQETPPVLRQKRDETSATLARSTIYQSVVARTFPEPVSLGARAVGWLSNQISLGRKAR